MGNTSFGKAPAWQAQRPKFWPQNPGRNTCNPSTEETVSPGGQASWTGSVNQKESALVWLQPLQQGPGCRRPAFLTSLATNSPHGLAKPRTCVKLRLGIMKWRQKSLTVLPCLRDMNVMKFHPRWVPHDLSHYCHEQCIIWAAKEIQIEQVVQFMRLSFISLCTDFLSYPGEVTLESTENYYP